VLATGVGVGFVRVLYAGEDLADRLWRSRPESLRPAIGGILLGLLLLAVPQMYGVGYPVLERAVSGVAAANTAPIPTRPYAPAAAASPGDIKPECGIASKQVSDIGLHHPPPAPPGLINEHPERVVLRALGSKPERARQEVGPRGSAQ
jgi:hypothetical protein